MNILITCDSFKDCLSSEKVGLAIIKGIEEIALHHHIQHIPIADGGEGSLSAINFQFDFDEMVIDVEDPLSRTIKAKYLVDSINKTAYIEMAQSSGLELLRPEERNCHHTSTYGLGQLIAHATRSGIKKIVLFIGGSATNDMGAGMACALGARFIGNDNKDIKRLAGKDLVGVQAVELPDALKGIELHLVCDVDNPLFGDKGASYVYGPQKGGTKADLVVMDKGMQNLNQLLVQSTMKDYSLVPGAGAAGGIGAMCMYLFNTTVINGGDFFFNFLGLPEYVKEAELVITGEGRMDGQTLHGKLVARLGKLCRENNVPLIAVCGRITMKNKDYELIPLAEAYSLSDLNNDQSYTPESTQRDLNKVGRIIANQYPRV